MKNLNKNIVLIGYRGVGKSFISNILSKNYDIEVISTDALIINKIGDIQNFITQSGWETFRTIETNEIKDIHQQKNKIIDCGGGVIEKPINMEYLKKNGVIFYLSAQAKTIIQRLKITRSRPSLTQNKSLEEEVHIILNKRIPLYKKYADHTVDVTKNKDLINAHKKIYDLYSNE